MELLCEGFDPALTLDLAYVQNGDKVCILSGDRSRLDENAKANGLTITESLADVGVIRPLNEKDDEDGDWKIDDNARFVVEGPYQRWGVKNANQRIYPKELFEDLIGKKDSYVLACINERRMLGHLEHPSDGRTNLKEVGIVTTGLTLHPNKADGGKTGVVRGRSELLETPNGQILRALSKAKIPWGVSSRGRGSVSNEGMVKWSGKNESDDFQLQTFDAVSDPSTPGARPTPVKESTKEKLTEAVKVEETDNDFVPGTRLSGQQAARTLTGTPRADSDMPHLVHYRKTGVLHPAVLKELESHEAECLRPSGIYGVRPKPHDAKMARALRDHLAGKINANPAAKNESLTDPDVPEAILNSITKTAGWVREGDTDNFRNSSLPGVRAEVQGVTAVRFVRESVNESGGTDSLSITVENQPYSLGESLDERAMSDAMVKARPAYSKRDDGDPMEPLAKQYIQYVKNGNSYSPAGDIQLKENLGRHAYRIGVGFSGPVFTKVQLKTDTLYHFKDACTERVLKEIDKFWGLKEGYEKLGIRHARGILCYGAPGTGKSSTINQVVEQVVERGDVVFYTKAVEHIAPCLKAFREVEPDRKVVIVLEDADGYINYSERELLNLMDGEEMFEGVLWLATTNYIDRFPPRLLRPGRFDKKIKIPPPTDEARTTYLHQKLKQFDVSEKECGRIAKELDGLSFAHLKEYIASVYAMGEPSEEVIERLKGERHLVECAENANHNFAPLDEDEIDDIANHVRTMEPRIKYGDKEEVQRWVRREDEPVSVNESVATVDEETGKVCKGCGFDDLNLGAKKCPKCGSTKIVNEAEKHVDYEATMRMMDGMPYTHNGIHGYIKRTGPNSLGHRPSAAGRKSQAYLKTKAELGDHWHTDFTTPPEAVWKHAEKTGRIVMKENVDESMDRLSMEEAAHITGKGTAGAIHRAVTAVKAAHGDSATPLHSNIGADVSGHSTVEKTHEALTADGWQEHRSGFDTLLGDSTYFRHPEYKTAEVGVHAMNGRRPVEGIHRVLGHKLLKTPRTTSAPTSESHIGFKKLTARLRAKGVQNPSALSAWIGRRKFGKVKFAKMAAAGAHHHESAFREVGATRLRTLSESFGLEPAPDFSKKTGKITFEGMADADGNLAAFSILTPKGVSHFVSVGGKDMNESLDTAPPVGATVYLTPAALKHFSSLKAKDGDQSTLSGPAMVKQINSGSVKVAWGPKELWVDIGDLNTGVNNTDDVNLKKLAGDTSEDVTTAINLLANGLAEDEEAVVESLRDLLKSSSNAEEKKVIREALADYARERLSDVMETGVGKGFMGGYWRDPKFNVGDHVHVVGTDIKGPITHTQHAHSDDEDHRHKVQGKYYNEGGMKLLKRYDRTKDESVDSLSVEESEHEDYTTNAEHVLRRAGFVTKNHGAAGIQVHHPSLKYKNPVDGRKDIIRVLNLKGGLRDNEYLHNERHTSDGYKAHVGPHSRVMLHVIPSSSSNGTYGSRIVFTHAKNESVDSLSVDEMDGDLNLYGTKNHRITRNQAVSDAKKLANKWKKPFHVHYSTASNTWDYSAEHPKYAKAGTIHTVHPSKNESMDSLSIDDTLTAALRTAVEERDDALETVEDLQSELKSAQEALDARKSQVKISESSEATKTAKDERTATGLSEITDAGRETDVTELPASVGTKMRPTVINDYVPPKANPANAIDENTDASVGIYRRWNRKP